MIVSALLVAFCAARDAKTFHTSTRGIGYDPTQIHLAWTASPSSMAITWISWFSSSQGLVRYGESGTGMKHVVKGQATAWTDPLSPFNTTRFVWRAEMSRLEAGQEYEYVVEDVTFGGKTDVLTFVARSEARSGVSFAVLSDFGLVNPQSLTMLRHLAENRLVDGVLSAGDYAYNLHSKDGIVGDLWMEQMQPILTRMSMIGVPGNHEQSGNFSAYKHRFTMPHHGQGHDGLYWSMNIGNVHLIGVDSEVYHTAPRSAQETMEKWLIDDLLTVNQHRDATPWVIVLIHRPLYCSASTTYLDSCDPTKNPQRIFLEDIFCAGGVDLVMQAHVHDYEREWPVYSSKVHRGYVNPPAPAYVVAGSAGCQEDIAPSIHDGLRNPWSAFYSHTYGIGVIRIVNDTHLTYEQHQARPEQALGGWEDPPIDSFTLVRTHRRLPHSLCIDIGK